MAQGADRMLMPAPPEDFFLKAVSLVVRENADWVPPGDQGALYMRPLLFGSGAELGVKASPEYTLVIFVSPVSSYFSGGARMRFLKEHHRAAPLGTGACKAPGNYAPCMLHQKAAKAAGFSDVIYLDTTGESIEEVAASNFFCVKDGALLTPELGTILPGITRDSVLRIARDEAGLEVREGKVSMADAFASTEAFCTGTGAGIAPIEHVANDDEKRDLAMPGALTTRLSKLLDDIRLERSEDKYQWLHDPFLVE